MGKREGPRVVTRMSCNGCKYEHSERYQVQGDSGHDVFCTHPMIVRKHIGDTSWTTPGWCPLLPEFDAVIRRRCTS